MSEAPRYPKRLIEVDLPIKRISAHARREKSIRHGHISTLHIWWARRPLAACRAVICAALWPDPADDFCPDPFRVEARRLMAKWAIKHLDSCSAESFPRFAQIQKRPASLENAAVLRTALLDFVADFCNWDNSSDNEYLTTSRALTHAAHLALGGALGSRPVIADPFAGGGAIPLECLRVGADAFSSDLNPVPVILNKVLLEYVPRFGRRLSDEVRKWGDCIGEELRSELHAYYPGSVEGKTVNSYIWARTILSEAPDQGRTPVEIPLVRSMLLLNKKGRYRVLEWDRDQAGTVVTEPREVAYADGSKRLVRRPVIRIGLRNSLDEVDTGTTAGGAATCPVSGFTTPVEAVRRQLSLRRGGAADARLICVISTDANTAGKFYAQPSRRDVEAVENARAELARRIRANVSQRALIPDGPINHLRGFFNVVLYGMTTWGDLFSPRQLLGLTTIAAKIRELNASLPPELAKAVQTCLALALDRCADKCASLVVWDNTRDMATHVFGRQALPMVWDFAEVNLLSHNGWGGALEWVCRVLDTTADAQLSEGVVRTASATEHPLPDDSVDSVITDPPYYAAIPYADLSDFFYSWLQRSLATVHPELLKDPLTPKDEECVSLAHRAAMYREKDAKWFERQMTKACEEARRITKPGGIGVFVFANKETAGWEAMLQALASASWTITASWPIDTEMGNRLRARNSAALASSIHLVCRPREVSDGSLQHEVGDWREVLEELPIRIHEWMPRLAAEGVVGADAIFACLGPALEIFSRYSRVERANGEVVALREYLEQVWAAVSREALSMIFADPDTAGLDEDARVTAIWLWTIAAPSQTSQDEEEVEETEDAPDTAEQATSSVAAGYVMEFDAARKIAQGLGAQLEALTHVVEVKGDKARLLPVAERTKYLFGGSDGAPAAKQRSKKKPQRALFEELEEVAEQQGWGEVGTPRVGSTTLDRVHQAMILFGAGRGEALKRFLVDEGVGRVSQFWKLAQALSALYPTGTDEKRWVDGVLARKKGLGF